MSCLCVKDLYGDDRFVVLNVFRARSDGYCLLFSVYTPLCRRDLPKLFHRAASFIILPSPVSWARVKCEQ